MVTTRSGINSSPLCPLISKNKKIISKSKPNSQQSGLSKKLTGNQNTGKDGSKENAIEVVVPHLDRVSQLRELLRQAEKKQLAIPRKGTSFN